MGVTRIDKITNEIFRGTAQVEQLGDKIRKGHTEMVWAHPEEGEWVYS